MNQSHYFNDQELLPFVGLVIVVIWIIVFNFSSGYKEFWSPLTIIAVIYGYYCCLGPYEAITTGDTFDRLQNMRKYYPSALWGGLISLLSYIAGFYLHGRGSKVKMLAISDEVLFEYGKKLVLIGFGLFTVSTRGNIFKLVNPLDAGYVQRAGGSFANYLALSLNFVIPAITMLFLYFLVTRRRLLWFIIPFVMATGIFITLGFRYRLVLLLCSMAIVYYQVKGKRPNVVSLVVGTLSLIAFMGILNISRQYGRGINVKKLENSTTETAYSSGLNESMIFQTSGAIIDIVPGRYPYVGFQPIWSTLLFPIPSKILPNKNSGEYLFDALDVVYGKRYSKGAAILAYGEYYLAFGWIGVVAGCVISGWYIRKLWNWFLSNSDNLLVVSAYAVTVSFLYVAISRGYLPQVANLFFFTVFPIYVAINAARKKYALSADAI